MSACTLAAPRLVVLAGFALWHVASGDSCAGLDLPPLSGCFRDQPPLGHHSCYKIAKINGTSSVQCAFGGGPTDAVRNCDNGKWVSGNVATCAAAPRSAWRVVNQDTTMRGWWLHELQFHSDSSCRTPLPAGSVRLEFAGGPTGAVDAAPRAAFDGDISNWWKAPCAGSGSFDFCGCRRDLGEGWSVTDKKCKPGYETNGQSEKDCLAAGAGGGQALGCPAGGASIGIHLATTTEITCVRMLQYDSSALSTTSMTLETWDKGGWQIVKTFSGLKTGAWQTLHVKKVCPIFQLPNYVSKWTRIASLNSGGAGDGDTIKVQCVDGSKEAQVTCQDGKWSAMPMISCYQPSIPSFPSGANFQTRTAQQNAQESEGMDPTVEMVLWLLGCIAGVFAVLGMLHIGRGWMQRQAYRDLIKQVRAAAQPEPDPVPTFAMRSPYMQAKMAQHFPQSSSKYAPSPYEVNGAQAAIMQSPTPARQIAIEDSKPKQKQSWSLSLFQKKTTADSDGGNDLEAAAAAREVTRSPESSKPKQSRGFGFFNGGKVPPSDDEPKKSSSASLYGMPEVSSQPVTHGPPAVYKPSSDEAMKTTQSSSRWPEPVNHSPPVGRPAMQSSYGHDAGSHRAPNYPASSMSSSSVPEPPPLPASFNRELENHKATSQRSFPSQAATSSSSFAKPAVAPGPPPLPASFQAPAVPGPPKFNAASVARSSPVKQSAPAADPNTCSCGQRIEPHCKFCIGCGKRIAGTPAGAAARALRDTTSSPQTQSAAQPVTARPVTPVQRQSSQSWRSARNGTAPASGPQQGLMRPGRQ